MTRNTSLPSVSSFSAIPTALLPLFDALDDLAQAGLLRRLGPALARFMASLGVLNPAPLLACTILSELEGRGHSCLMLQELADNPSALLGWKNEQWSALAELAQPLPNDLASWRHCLSNCQQIWLVTDVGNNQQQPLVLDQDRLYLRRYWKDETNVADAIGARADSRRTVDIAQAQHWLNKLFDSSSAATEHAAEPDWQKIACAIALRSQLSIITGGPGTGKTYTVARLLALLFASATTPENLRIALAAPTGKAAARLKQAIDAALEELSDKVGSALPLAQLSSSMGAARTLHSLLGARPNTRFFSHHSGNQLDVDVLIVDEASMVHLEMMAAILAALPATTMLILLGDKDQLASVEAGAVLGDLCRNAEAGAYGAQTLDYLSLSCGIAVPQRYLGDGGALSQQTVMLRQSRRFSGPIGQLALAVNSGNNAAASAILRANLHTNDGPVLNWMTQAQTKEMLQLALNGRSGAEGGYCGYLSLLNEQPKNHVAGTNLVAEHEKWALNVLQRFESFRILCAVREGAWGVAGLNSAIEQALDSQKLIKRHSEWYIGRPVMITRNDHGTGVYNGDIGICLPDPLRKDAQRVYFLEGPTVRSVLATRLRDVVTAYAMTVHKSQGSEFSHTVLVLPEVSSPVLSRELVYTGITRARSNFTLVTPSASVFDDALKRRTLRASGLASLLDRF
ncbi:exodeoxyribonuclease V subunit alpha [Undibacterium sp. Ren11W]|uniref:exodeoxyribonuclease V subunit alpha n=1 Tax=Undibacterium sp. Ren11W TaxID=3413045 RepID=UPI003BF4122E